MCGIAGIHKKIKQKRLLSNVKNAEKPGLVRKTTDLMTSFRTPSRDRSHTGMWFVLLSLAFKMTIVLQNFLEFYSLNVLQPERLTA